MVFIEAKRDPNSTLKLLSQKVEERSKSEERNAFKKPENREPGMAMPGGTVVPPRTARPCHFSGPPAVPGLGCKVRARSFRARLASFRACFALFSSVLLSLVLGASSILYSSLNLLLKSSFPLKPEDFS